MSGTPNPHHRARRRVALGRGLRRARARGLLLLLSSFAIWVNRVALNTDVFADTSTELIEDDAIRQAVVDEGGRRALRVGRRRGGASAAVAARLPAACRACRRGSPRGRLPPRRPRAPAAAAAASVGVSIEQSHRTLVAVLEGDEGTVSTTGGVVSLDLEPIVLEAADRIGCASRSRTTFRRTSDGSRS